MRAAMDAQEQVTILSRGTGMVGDPSGRIKTRPQLSEAEVTAHAETYLT